MALHLHGEVLILVFCPLLVVAELDRSPSGMIPVKYLVVSAWCSCFIYQVFVMGYTGYVSFTNYGQGHNSTKDDAISAILKVLPPEVA